MATATLQERGADLFEAWQAQIGRQRGTRLMRGPRPFAAVIYRYRGFAVDGLIELGRIQVDVLHDSQSAGSPVTVSGGGRREVL
ncbi:MAG: hypothetical protein IT427_06000 [Pirellulales bacterium]|nr:hypothetical protein [Pirellulales bacterium]